MKKKLHACNSHDDDMQYIPRLYVAPHPACKSHLGLSRHILPSTSILSSFSFILSFDTLTFIIQPLRLMQAQQWLDSWCQRRAKPIDTCRRHAVMGEMIASMSCRTCSLEVGFVKVLSIHCIDISTCAYMCTHRRVCICLCKCTC